MVAILSPVVCCADDGIDAGLANVSSLAYAEDEPNRAKESVILSLLGLSTIYFFIRMSDSEA